MKLVLDLDDRDADAIREATAMRQMMPLPVGDSCDNGALLAEICRGWMEMVTTDEIEDGEGWKKGDQ